MIVYPAIDLRGGVCVRLMHGRFDQVTAYDEDPQARLAAFAAAGADWVHIVDLDGAEQGRAVQHALIGELAASGLARVVVGSLAVSAPETVIGWLERFGPDRLTLALDVKLVDGAPVPALKGWTEAAGVDLWTALERYAPGVARHVLITDVGRDGALTGPNLELLAEVRRRRPDLQVQASGGVSNVADLTAARDAGCAGAIVGRAIYEGRFTVEQALEAVR